MNIFDCKSVRPMLLREESEAFDSSDFLFELKFDGSRAIAFLSEGGTFMINRMNWDISRTTYPELDSLHKQAAGTCVLDGEIIAMTDGKSDFKKLQERALNTDRRQAEEGAKKDPVQFAVFDILHFDGRDVTDLPLTERKKLLERVVTESERIIISKYMERNGRALFERAQKEGLEGIIAKRKNSPYIQGARNGDWLKIKVQHDEDYLLAGYKVDVKTGKITALCLMQSMGGSTVDCSWFNFNLTKADSNMLIRHTKEYIVSEKDGTVQLKPARMCIISYTKKSADGKTDTASPLYKGIRID